MLVLSLAGEYSSYEAMCLRLTGSIRSIYETPAGTILREAHLDLEGITQDREVGRLLNSLSLQFSQSVYNGYVFILYIVRLLSYTFQQILVQP